MCSDESLPRPRSHAHRGADCSLTGNACSSIPSPILCLLASEQPPWLHFHVFAATSSTVLTPYPLSSSPVALNALRAPPHSLSTCIRLSLPQTSCPIPRLASPGLWYPDNLTRSCSAVSRIVTPVFLAGGSSPLLLRGRGRVLLISR